MTGTTFAHWRSGSSWSDIAVVGTARLLADYPYLIIESYGEDPQLFLPEFSKLPALERIKIEIELRSRSFAVALEELGGKRYILLRKTKDFFIKMKSKFISS